jgi:hypothetical protein
MHWQVIPAGVMVAGFVSASGSRRAAGSLNPAHHVELARQVLAIVACPQLALRGV